MTFRLFGTEIRFRSHAQAYAAAKAAGVSGYAHEIVTSGGRHIRNWVTLAESLKKQGKRAR